MFDITLCDMLVVFYPFAYPCYKYILNNVLLVLIVNIRSRRRVLVGPMCIDKRLVAAVR